MRGEDQTTADGKVAFRGSPPHARGRRRVVGCGVWCLGDHPRMRGEDFQPHFCELRRAGSPPHARGRRPYSQRRRRAVGITPACAGKTRAPRPTTIRAGDHPRMRGEDPAYGSREAGDDGSPPHARGRLLADGFRDVETGSPPHARGRRPSECGPLRRRRITPACAGKTYTRSGMFSTTPDHPRMRGEDAHADGGHAPRDGSPPHARGRLVLSSRKWQSPWITPACAGKTYGIPSAASSATDHPRMRGEDSTQRLA